MTARLRLVSEHESYRPSLLGGAVHYPGGEGSPLTELEAETLRMHINRHGARPSCVSERAGEALVDELERIQLTGRGGGHFFAASKWRAMRSAHRSGRTVVANGAEGEPLSRKDVALVELRPHLVLDGLACAAESVRAAEAVIWLHEGAHFARATLARALAERRRAGLGDPPIRIATGPDHYLTGESSAVVNGVAHGRPLPSAGRVPSASRSPATLVHNVETLARVALAARGEDDGDSVLVSVANDTSVVVLELPDRWTVRDAVRAAIGDDAPAAVLLGGYGGRWLNWAETGRYLLRQSDLRADGLSLGAGVIATLPAGRCGLARTAEIARFLADSSARQCGPCLFGLAAIADSLDALVAGGRRHRREAARLVGFVAEVRGRGACHHPDGAARMVASALETFELDVHAHLRGRCLHADATGRTAGAHRA